MAQSDMVENEGDAVCLSHFVGSNDHVRNQWYSSLTPYDILYANLVFLGYDGSLMNGLEAMDSWNECKT